MCVRCSLVGVCERSCTEAPGSKRVARRSIRRSEVGKQNAPGRRDDDRTRLLNPPRRRLRTGAAELGRANPSARVPLPPRKSPKPCTWSLPSVFCFPDPGGDLAGQCRHARDRRRDGVFCDEETHAPGAGHLLFDLFIHNAEHFGRGGGPKSGSPPRFFQKFFSRRASL